MHAEPQAIFDGVSLVGVGLIGMVTIAGLLLFSSVVVATVLVASRHSLIAWQKLKAALAVLVWVVPAAAVVIYVARDSRSPFEPQMVQEVFVQSVNHANQSASSDLVHTAVSHSVDSAATGAAVGSEASPPRLVVRGISSDEPNWLKGTHLVEGRETSVVSSRRFATMIEAEDDLTRDVVERVKSAFTSVYRLPGDWSPPIPVIDRLAVKDIVGEVMDWDFGNGTTGKMYRAHARLDLSPQFQAAIQQTWRSRIVERRLLGMGGVLGLVTLMLGTAAGYFRLDALTDGRFRRRLKLAAVALIAAGSLVAARVVA